MAALVLIRHAPTAWNEAGRIQGRADPPLSPAGRAEAARWRVPAGWREAAWYASPLRRARETAALLTDRPVAVEPRLAEMAWGAFEGCTLAALRAQAPAAMAAREALGLDFRPPGGESPRDVAARLRDWIEALPPGPELVVAVAHNGVLRAALVLATGWDLTGKPPLRLARGQALRLACGPDGIALAGPPLDLGAG